MRNKEIDQKTSDTKAYAEKKVAKRQKELAYLDKDLESSRHYQSNPDKFDKEVKQEIENALLRLAENQIIDEMKLEEMEKELQKKDSSLATTK